MHQKIKSEIYHLFLGVALLLFVFSANATDNFVKIKSLKGVSIELPKNWFILSKNQRINLDTVVESGLDLAGEEQAKSTLPLVANLFNNGLTIGIVNLRFYPKLTSVSQIDAKQATEQFITALDNGFKKNIIKGMNIFGMQVLSWEGTKKVTINGITALVTEYHRKEAVKGAGTFRVRLVRVLAKKRTFTLTVSYSEKYAFPLKMITDRIISSLKLSTNQALSNNKSKKVIPKTKEVKQNSSKAIDVRACDLKNGAACFKLGISYALGIGIKQDSTIANNFFKKACDLEEGSGCVGLGISYAKGTGIKQDSKKANNLYKKACDLKNNIGCFNLGVSFAKGVGIKQDSTKANNFYKKACDLKNGAGCVNLGTNFDNGIGVKQNSFKANNFYKKSCDLKEGSGCSSLGINYEKGAGIKQDSKKANIFFKKACDLKNGAGCFNLGVSYESGRGIKEDAAKALFLLGKSCDLKVEAGCSNYAIMKKRAH